MALIVDMDTTITTGQTGIIYNADNIRVIIDTNVNVVSHEDSAIVSSDLFSGNTLVNNGNVSSPRVGVGFLGNDSSIVNNANGSISGDTGVSFIGDGVELTNHGAISGMVNGVRFASQNDGGVINNSGSIRSDSVGVQVNTQSPGFTTEIDNGGGGVIKGGYSGIQALTNGQISLDNSGKVVGGIKLSGVIRKDVIINRGKIKGDVSLGSGNDKYKGKSDGTSGHVFGEDGHDRLIGSKAKDYLDGGADNDLLRGGKGKDKQFGGSDSDTFDFNSIKDSVVGSKRDKIIDFQPGDDEIDLKSIDAKKGSGNQTFKWIGDKNFHDKKGELRIKDKGSKVIVQGDVKGDGHADFEILVKGGNLHDDDFVL
jgi:Ca2+-binding RTX toxin-like protein